MLFLYYGDQLTQRYKMGLFDDIFDIATAPIKVAVEVTKVGLDVTSVVTKPVADIANEVVDTAQEISQDIRNSL